MTAKTCYACGGDIPPERECYRWPVCHDCLPPPPPLPLGVPPRPAVPVNPPRPRLTLVSL